LQSQLFGLSTQKIYSLISKARVGEPIISITPLVSFEEDGKRKILYKIFSMEEIQEYQLDVCAFLLKILTLLETIQES
jgi:hypothetical protein